MSPGRTLTDEDVAAISARVVADLRQGGVLDETVTTEEFARRVGRGPKWVLRQIRARLIKTVAGQRPYRIPASELRRVLEGRR